MFPIINNETFTTEVHHINGEGVDGGVVYSEMQARENTLGDLSDRKLMDLLYPNPEGNHGYNSQTGMYIYI